MREVDPDLVLAVAFVCASLSAAFGALVAIAAARRRVAKEREKTFKREADAREDQLGAKRRDASTFPRLRRRFAELED